MIPIHSISQGNGSPVILIHGIAASLYDWGLLMPALFDAGHRVMAIDLPGHGDSAQPKSPDVYTANIFSQSLEAWVDGLKDRPPFILVGHSFGGYLSLEYARRHPDKVSALVLIAPFYKREQISPLLHWLHRFPALGGHIAQRTPLPLIDRALRWDPIQAAQFSPQARWQIAVDYKRASPNIYRLIGTAQDLTPGLSEIEIPTLVIWGQKDLTLKPASFGDMVAAMPQASGRAMPGCGHQPHVGRPEMVNRLVLEFVLKVGGYRYDRQVSLTR
jgi:pimeloyl-ACP methyl ester carboxylesterase